MKIQIDMAEVNQLMATIRTGGLQVLVRTINNTLKGCSTIITNEIAADVNLQKGFIRKQEGKKSEQTFMIRYASVADAPYISGLIETKSANVPLIYYSNQRGNKKKYAKTISVMVKKDRGRERFRHVFVATMQSGHRGIFEIERPPRKSRITGRYVIKQKYGPRIPDIMSNEETIKDIEKEVTIRMDKELNRQLDYMLSIYR